MSTLKVNTIQDTTGNDALTIDSSGNVTASQGFVPSTQLSHRNLIINGAMQVAQRGTSQTTDGYGSLDRWKWNKVSSAGTMSQQTFTVGSEVDGQKNYLSFDITTGDNFTGFRTYIEGVRSVPSNSQYTVSFWAKGTNPGASNVRVRMIHNFGSSGSSAVEPNSKECSLTSTWTKYTYTFTAPDYTGKTISGGNDYVALVIEQRSTDTSTDAWNMDITSVQLEVGSVATPFEHRSYGEELARCQRYYEKVSLTGSTTSYYYAGSQNNLLWVYGVTKRTAPTVSVSYTANSASVIASRIDYTLLQASNYFAIGALSFDAEL